jgi:hypothetical protein
MWKEEEKMALMKMVVNNKNVLFDLRSIHVHFFFNKPSKDAMLSNSNVLFAGVICFG